MKQQIILWLQVWLFNMQKSKKRHIAKAITWRIIASVTTFLVARWFFSEDPNATQKATWVALSESAIKMLFYYFHERAWYKSNIGLDPEQRKSKSDVSK
jgi:uncharacterized membrane protein